MNTDTLELIAILVFSTVVALTVLSPIFVLFYSWHRATKRHNNFLYYYDLWDKALAKGDEVNARRYRTEMEKYL